MCMYVYIYIYIYAHILSYIIYHISCHRSYHTMTYHTVSHHDISYATIVYHTRSYNAMLYHTIPYKVNMTRCTTSVSPLMLLPAPSLLLSPTVYRWRPPTRCMTDGGCCESPWSPKYPDWVGPRPQMIIILITLGQPKATSLNIIPGAHLADVRTPNSHVKNGKICRFDSSTGELP